MIRSGIVPIDEVCGGIRPRSSYLLTGGAGAGKTTYSLQFANHGLRCGERIAMLTHAPREELFALTDHFGINVRDPLREGRLLLLRYRSDFPRRLARAGSADRMLDDLRELIGDHRPRRVIIDTFAPLLEDGSASPLAALAIAEVIEASRTTALLTYPMDLGAGYDRRLEPVVQSAAGVFRLVRDEHGARRLEVVALRHFPSLPGATDYAPPNAVMPNEPAEVR